MRTVTWVFVLALGLANLALAADELRRREWTVEGVTREALVHVPAEAQTSAAPVVFAFHGHGGTMQRAAETLACHRHWPAALVVYMQGLNTPGALTDPEGKRPGWQRTVGDQGDRDLKLFDAVLASLRQEYRIDERRIYATGHSNGGAFTYLLWAARGDTLAAVAPSGAVMRRPQLDLKPKPVLHIAGENDRLVRFEWQQRMIDAVRQVNGCGAGEPAGPRSTLYPSSRAAPLVTYIYPGGHQFPAEAAPVIVTFFQQHARP